MGVLGTMTVNFTANVQGLQSSVSNKSAEEMQEDFQKGLQELTVEKRDTTAIEMISQGILDMAAFEAIAKAAVEGVQKAMDDKA